jgi:GTPase
VAGFRSGFVTLAGWTNVGKSTLLNRLVGEKLAAVSAVAQTTRRRVTGALQLPGRGQVVFVDTPGFHAPKHRMNRAMVETARRALLEVDLVLLVVDASLGPGAGDARAAAIVRAAGTRALGVLNKIDLVAPKSRLLPMMRTIVDVWGLAEAVPVSAQTGEGCEILVDRAVSLLPEAEPMFPEDYLTGELERDLAAEWIREKVLRHTRQEIPHATAVVVDRWLTRADGLVEIEATILVERESQKAIVIGRGGALLKTIGTEARHDIETLLGSRVYLGLHVRAREDWREDARTLGELGIE